MKANLLLSEKLSTGQHLGSFVLHVKKQELDQIRAISSRETTRKVPLK